MHILFIAGWWPTKQAPINGVFIQEHAMAISKYAKVTVVYLNAVEKSVSWTDFPSSATIDTQKIDDNLEILTIDLKLRIRRFGLLERQMDKLISTIIQRYQHGDPIDIIHLNVLNTRLTWNILRNAKKIKKPLVLTEHSTFYHTEIYQLPAAEVEAKKAGITQRLNQPGLKYILPVSFELGRVMNMEYSVSDKKIRIIPNVANDLFLSAPLKKTSSQNEIFIFAAAYWAHSKNPLLFFELLSLLKKRNYEMYSRLRINWGGDGDKMPEVKEIVKNKLPDLQINFMGVLTKKIIAEQMIAADFLVHPTDAENLPCIIIESLCAGLPVLSANVNGVKELIDGSNGKMYAAKDVEDFYLRFMEMITHIQQFDREKIARDARKKYSATAIGQQIMDIYERVLSK
jgi:glycosyltransferase involved in cell wall biosynthesis